jgi:5-methyltetrahydrofolate--homocysteine methyltransferase
VIGLAMDDDGIPQTAQKRLQVAGKIIKRAQALGIPSKDVIIDPLVLAVCTNAQAAQETLQAIRMIVQEYGVNITMGASNVSHGLPNRSTINAAFMAMSVAAGLTCPITNPLSTSVREAILASDLILGRDEWAMNWIAHFRSK